MSTAVPAATIPEQSTSDAGVAPDVVSPNADVDEPAFAEFVERFAQLYSGKRFSELDRLAPASGGGIVVLRNRGVPVEASESSSLGRALGAIQWNIEKLHKPLAPLVRGTFPTVDCSARDDGTSPTIYGRVHRSDHLLDVDGNIVRFPNERVKTRARLLSGKITHFIYDTSISLGIFFAATASGWQAVALDLVSPCSA